MIITVITFLLVAKCSWCLPLDQLYPFGPDANDRVLNTNDPGPAKGLGAALYFDSPELRQDFNSAQLRQDLYIRQNGIITFTPSGTTGSPSTSTPIPFPVEDLDFIAPYWFDSDYNTCINISNFNRTDDFNTTSSVNGTLFANQTFDDNYTSVNTTECRYSNTVYYRADFDSDLHARTTREIRAGFFGLTNVAIRRLLVITWVITDTQAGLPEPKQNVFQCLLANDGPRSYVIFNYADGLSPLTNESNPLPVQAGINAGFGPTPNFVSIPNTSNISVTSNVGIPGVWMFQTETRPFTTPFPPIGVTINTDDEQIIGQPFTMECRVGPAMDIEYTFSINWTIRFYDEVRFVPDIPGNLLNDYSDSYTIPRLSESDRFVTYRCELMVNFNRPAVVGYADFSLNDLTGGGGGNGTGDGNSASGLHVGSITAIIIGTIVGLLLML